MVTMWNLCQVHVVVLSLVILNFVISSTNAQPFDYPIANLSNSWTNNNPSFENRSLEYQDGSKIRSILLRNSGPPFRSGPRFACGFYCNGNCTFFLFAIFIVQTNSASEITQPIIGFPQVVWSANRNNPVRENATLQLTKDGDLVLRDVDGTLVWSTNTTRQSVVGLSMTEIGNLILYDRNNRTVWQSFDHPTDSLDPGQSLLAGKKLTASVSSLNSTEGGLFSLSVTTEGLFAYIESNPLQFYYEFKIVGTNAGTATFVKFMNGSIAIFTSISGPNQPLYTVFQVSSALSAQYIKLASDGHLKVFGWSSEWKEVDDLLTGHLGKCKYPLVCGSYGICSNEECGCPGATDNEESYFRLINDRKPNSGCVPVTTLSCESPQDHKLLDLNDVTYFYFPANITNTDIESCKQACLKNCSCKAALFRYWENENASNGSCFLPSQLFSLMENEKRKTHYNSSAFIKVQVSRTESTSQTKIILGSSLGALSGLLLIIGISVVLFRIKNTSEEKDEEYLDQVPGMATRFTYEDLKVATGNFLKKLGQGGFGSVFEGTLVDGSKVAVKCLDGIGQVKKSFLAEVETIGSIHHVNLVRLVGFCADKSHRLLVYEYMSNGSLEKWIFNQNHESSLSWQTRRNIILEVAKGVTYLHEECRQKIFHLDIKPQNILLDDNFNAKVSDFGLSKLIDKDQSQVITTMRGTRGYLAPEWLNSIITEKVDVYSFGVVVLEIVCGRKNLDYSQPEESMHLLSVLKTKAEEDRLSDMVDENSEDMLIHKKEIMEMIRIAVWCLQSDYTKRPSMSVVVKVIEGLMEVELNLDYTFSTTVTPSTMIQQEAKFGSSTPLLASVLSGPR